MDGRKITGVGGNKMRDLKFRAWDKDNNKMVYFPNLGVMRDIDTGSQELLLGAIEHLNGYEGINYFLDVSDSTELMQYTGLKDKNGKEVYEGDIVLVLDRDWPSGNYYSDQTPRDYMLSIASTCSVIFEQGEFILEQVKGCGYYYPNVGRYDYHRDIYEVIGNIWENPELLNLEEKGK